MTREDPEAFLRAMLALLGEPLSAVRPGTPLPGVPFSPEAVANAFVMLGLLPEPRAEEILAECRSALEAKGFRTGVLTGEMSVRPGAHGFQEARAACGCACVPPAGAMATRIDGSTRRSCQGCR